MHKLSGSDVKQVELNILRQFDALCREHQLTYLLAYGTALGAARHGGFIPWDDDIDVFMPRDDYDRLFSLYSGGSLATDLKLVSYHDESSIYSFFKLTDPGTRVVETYLREEYALGLWIDIFPLERIYPGDRDRALKTYRANARRLFVKAQRVANTNVGATKLAVAAKKAIAPLTLPLNPYRIAATIDAASRGLHRPEPERPGQCLWLCAMEPFTSTLFHDHDLLFPTVPVRFEGYEFPGPHEMERYLAQCYGDWRELPPESERHAHFPEAYELSS